MTNNNNESLCVYMLTLFDEEVGQSQHDGVAAVQEVSTHQVRARHRQT